MVLQWVCKSDLGVLDCHREDKYLSHNAAGRGGFPLLVVFGFTHPPLYLVPLQGELRFKLYSLPTPEWQ